MAWYTFWGHGSVDALSLVKEGISGRSCIRVGSGSVKQTNLEIVSRLILPPFLNKDAAWAYNTTMEECARAQSLASSRDQHYGNTFLGDVERRRVWTVLRH